jgi:cytochrome c oxidase subunit 2
MNEGSFPILPPDASTFAYQVNLLFYALTLLTVIFTVIVLAAMIFLSIRYRRGAQVDRSHPVDTDHRLELAWSLGPLAIGLVIFVWAAVLYPMAFRPPANAEEIFVVGKQWMWHIQHPNGIRENNELHVPTGRPFKLTMISQDVIHDFWVPAFRVKRDVIPGHYTTCWFEATEPGKYHIFCSQYCGTNHSEMTGYVYVMTPEDYERWEENGGPSGESTTPMPRSPTLAEQGKVLYDQQACGSCHDADATSRGPILTGLYGHQGQLPSGQPATIDTAYIREWLLNPPEKISDKYQQSMPSYKGQLTEFQILQLAAFIKSPPASGTTPASTPTGTTPSTPQNGPVGSTATRGQVTTAGNQNE